MFRSFFPDEYLDSAYVIDYEKLYREGRSEEHTSELQSQR